MNIRNSGYDFESAAKALGNILARDLRKDIPMDTKLREYLEKARTAQEDLSQVGTKNLEKINNILGHSGANPIYPEMASMSTPTPKKSTVSKSKLRYAIRALFTVGTLNRQRAQSKEISDILG